MEFERFDICEAWYLFAMNFHGGQASGLYRVFGRLKRMGFRASPLLRRPQDLTENGKAIYRNLVLTHPESPYRHLGRERS